MDAALSRLLVLRFRGGLRHRVSQLATRRGAVFILVVVAIVWLLLAADASTPGDYLGAAFLQDPIQARQHIAEFMPLGLLAASLFTVFVATGPALYFSPNEINFLFTGPFNRRDLVIYKFCTYFAGAIVSALIITLLIPPRTSSGLTAFTGTFLTLSFIQLSSAAVGIFGQAFVSNRFIQARRPVIGLAFAIACAAVFYVTATTDQNVFDVLAAFRSSWPGTVILAPFAVFAELFLARSIFPDLVGWAIVALLINAALLLVIIALDGRTSDRSLSESHRLSRRWLRVRRGGSMWASDKTTGRSLHRAPGVGGLGPVAWRQAINAVRNSGRVILVFAALAMLTGPFLASADMNSAGSSTTGLAYFFIAFVLPRTLVCDFRGELGRMEHYKALPIAPWRICAGQLVAPVVLASAIQMLMIFSILPFLDITSALILATLTVFTLPFNLLLYGLENLVFLLFPTKLVPVGRVDFDFLGRALVDFVLKTIVIFTSLGIARLTGLAAQRFTGELWLSFGLTSWLTLTTIGLLTVPLMALAFGRFKISETIE